MKIRRRILASKRECLDRTIRESNHTIVGFPRRIESFKLQVVHIVVQKRCLGDMAFGAAAFSKKDYLALHLQRTCFFGVKLSEWIQLRSR